MPILSSSTLGPSANKSNFLAVCNEFVSERSSALPCETLPISMSKGMSRKYLYFCERLRNPYSHIGIGPAAWKFVQNADDVTSHSNS